MTKPPRKPSQPLLGDAEAPLRSRPRRRRDPDQPQLPFDPMPERIEPCLALLKPKPPKGPQWRFEIKWDGYRLHVHIEPGRVRILTKGGHDWTHRFPAIAAEAAQLGVATAIMDAEAVVLDEQGRSDFGRLQKSLGGRGGKRVSDDSVAMAFDLMYFDGHDLRGAEQHVRRHLLESFLADDRRGAIRLSEELEADGELLLKVAREHQLEGIIAKDRNSPYRSGRFGDWVKIKCVQSGSFAIVGYELSMSARGHLAGLMLAARRGGKLVYVGHVGTGFKESEAWKLRAMMNKIPAKRPAVDYAGSRKSVVWVRPTLIAEIEFIGWTADGKLRHASYKGLRERADGAVVEEI
ncbi:ATP-dependent DNA ligase [Rhizobium sp. R339]|uniref:non-homologous end-joining DNA ligase n=1 Tax=Rhizobium sp. R339 TaxID=1764273 RepID=UPI000B529EEE|nr:non-homologous end-joining DNA ligase [Rhizobium sp. R339]OWV67960.1 ATP-dependent DNA ligase [Rhizobium sp. R339]